MRLIFPIMCMFFVLAYPTGRIRAMLIIHGLVLERKSAFVKCIIIQNRQNEAIKQPINMIMFIIFPYFLNSFLFSVIKFSFGFFFFSNSYMANGNKPIIVPIKMLIQESCLI